MTTADPPTRGRRSAAWIVLTVVAALGALLAAAQLAIDLLFRAVSRGTDTSAMTFGTVRVVDPWFALILLALAAALVVIAVGARHRWAQWGGVVVGLAGTVVSAIGLVSGGGAGPAPAAYWWVLTIAAGVAAVGSTSVRLGRPR